MPSTLSSRDVLAANLTRLRAGRSVVSIAYAAGITADTLYKLERGDRWITAETLDSLAAALGTTPANLLRPAKTQAGNESEKLSEN